MLGPAVIEAGRLIHLGQSVADAGDTIDRFINTPFAVPTGS